MVLCRFGSFFRAAQSKRCWMCKIDYFNELWHRYIGRVLNLDCLTSISFSFWVCLFFFCNSKNNRFILRRSGRMHWLGERLRERERYGLVYPRNVRVSIFLLMLQKNKRPLQLHLAGAVHSAYLFFCCCVELCQQKQINKQTNFASEKSVQRCTHTHTSTHFFATLKQWYPKESPCEEEQ